MASPKLSGQNIRRLITLREQVKVASVQLPRPLQRRLLEILERARPWRIPAPPVPERSRAELVRAIRWRLGTIPLPGVVAASAFIARHRRAAARRRPDRIRP